MTETILVFSGSIAMPRYRWFETASGKAQAGTAESAAAAFPDPGLVTVLLGSAHVLLTDVQVKVRNRRLLDSAVAYALEDHLADDVENLLFDVGPETNDRYPVAITARALVAAVAEDLAAAGVTRIRFVPYPFALPYEPGQVCALDDGTLTIVRTGPYAGFTACDDAAKRLLARLDGASTTTAPPMSYAHADADPATGAADPAQRIAAPAFNAWLARNLAADPPLQFEPAMRGRKPGPARRLAIAGVLLLAALVVHTGFVYSKTATNEQRLAQLEQRTHSVFARAFPHVKRIVNPRVQADRLLAELATGEAPVAGFLDGLHALGGSIAGLGEDARIKSIRYQQGRFDLMLDVDGIATLERIRSQLGARNFRVEIISADNRADHVSGRLRLEQELP